MLHYYYIITHKYMYYVLLFMNGHGKKRTIWFDVYFCIPNKAGFLDREKRRKKSNDNN